MILQTANQFQEGMNLDTNPIAMNNHLLGAALNATMITMNGNELVLLNDMGNGRVESALLPAGYVPVGMAEFGGIVYVASHNPLTGLSQIGSFPSPERNISSDEEDNSLDKTFLAFSNKASNALFAYLNAGDLYISNLNQKLGIRVDNPIRPGDKFSIEMSNEEDFVNLLKLIKAGALVLEPCTINSDGAFITIDLLIDPYTYKFDGEDYESFIYFRNSEFDRRFNVYRNKIVGDLYLKLTLNVPNNIPYYIIADSEDGSAYYTIHMPKIKNISKYKVLIEGDTFSQTIDVDGSSTLGLFSTGTIQANANDFTYYLGSDRSETFMTLTYKFNEGDKGIHKYTIIPYFEPTANVDQEVLNKNSGYLITMAFTGTINLHKIGRGIIDFTQFRYYNNTNTGTFTINYSMETYLKASLFVSSVDLCTVPYESLLENGTLSTNAKTFKEGEGMYATTIGTSKMSYFGNFLSSLSYTDGEDLPALNKGNVYVAFLRATIETTINSQEVTYKYSKPFLLFTSSIANYLFASNMDSFIDASTANNPNSAGSEEISNLVWDDYIGIPCRFKWPYDSIDNTTTTIESSGYTLPITSNSNKVWYKATKQGTVEFELHPTIDLNVGNDFPFDVNTIKAEYIDFEVKKATYSYTPNLVGTYPTSNLDNMLLTQVENYDCTGDYDVKFLDGKLICNTRLVSLFEGGVIQVENETRSGSAFLPLLDPNLSSLMLGLELWSDPRQEERYAASLIKPTIPNHYELTKWATYGSYKGNAGRHSRRYLDFNDATVGISNDSPLRYLTLEDARDASIYMPGTDDPDAQTEIFGIKTDFRPWKNYVEPLREHWKNTYGIIPLIAFLLPNRNVGEHNKAKVNNGGSSEDGGFKNYDTCIPMLLDTNGIYRTLEDIGYAFSWESPNSGESHIGYVSRLMDMYSTNGFIILEDLTYTISYKYGDPNNYVYSLPYNCTYSIDIVGRTNISLGELFPEDAIIKATYNPNEVTLQGFKEGSEYNLLNSALSNIDTYTRTNAVKLPKAALIDANNQIRKTDATTVDLTINSVDIDSLVITFLSDAAKESTTPLMKDGQVFGSVDFKGQPLNYKCMYFIDDDGLIVSSQDLPSSTFKNKYSNAYKALAKHINGERLIIMKRSDYSDLYGLYINYSKATALGYIVPKNSVTRYDRVGMDRAESIGALYGGVKIALVGKASPELPYDNW